MAISAAGTPMTATIAAETATPNCGWLNLVHHGGGTTRGLSAAADASSPAPSNRRSAASIAASRRAGRGGGGCGSDMDRSSSIGIGQPHSAHRVLVELGRRDEDMPRRPSTYRSSCASAGALFAARTSWTNSER
jgi:hypothetical protein